MPLTQIRYLQYTYNKQQVTTPPPHTHTKEPHHDCPPSPAGISTAAGACCWWLWRATALTSRWRWGARAESCCACGWQRSPGCSARLPETGLCPTRPAPRSAALARCWLLGCAIRRDRKKELKKRGFLLALFNVNTTESLMRGHPHLRKGHPHERQSPEAFPKVYSSYVQGNQLITRDHSSFL